MIKLINNRHEKNKTNIYTSLKIQQLI